MTLGELPTEERPAPLRPLRSTRAERVLIPAALCLLFWPSVFGMSVVATFLGALVHFGTWAGPLFWPIAYVGSALLYALLLGLPLLLCGRRRHWGLRVIPWAIAAVPVCWATSAVGLWALPGALVIALSIMVETTDGHHRWIAAAADRLLAALRGTGTSA
ncbi:MAG TPA: hypothetical protein VKZ65_16550 [Glycomyces sp.]|nr:hypothetical protein [Glycomyces sp.]